MWNQGAGRTQELCARTGLSPAGSSLARSIFPRRPRCSPEPELSSLLVPSLTSQTHRVAEVEKELSSNSPAQAGPSRAGGPGPRSRSFLSISEDGGFTGYGPSLTFVPFCPMSPVVPGSPFPPYIKDKTNISHTARKVKKTSASIYLLSTTRGSSKTCRS